MLGVYFGGAEPDDKRHMLGMLILCVQYNLGKRIMILMEVEGNWVP